MVKEGCTPTSHGIMLPSTIYKPSCTSDVLSKEQRTRVKYAESSKRGVGSQASQSALCYTAEVKLGRVRSPSGWVTFQMDD